jgi:hypothetical protein
MYDDELVLFRVQENRMVEVIGDSPEAAQIRDYIAVDEARRNIAELGLGCNDKAVISGNVLEDEKVLGMHWALGRSDHIGGTVGVTDFSDPSGSLVMIIAIPSRIVYNDGCSPEHLVLKESGNDPSKERPAASTHRRRTRGAGTDQSCP